MNKEKSRPSAFPVLLLVQPLRILLSYIRGLNDFVRSTPSLDERVGAGYSFRFGVIFVSTKHVCLGNQQSLDSSLLEAHINFGFKCVWNSACYIDRHDKTALGADPQDGMAIVESTS